jgi:hypothetical protein
MEIAVEGCLLLPVLTVLWISFFHQCGCIWAFVYISVHITLFLTVHKCYRLVLRNSFFFAIPLEFLSLRYVHSGSPVWTALIKFYKALKIRQKMSNDFSASATALSFFCLKEHSIELLSCLLKKTITWVLGNVSKL